jgi:glutathione S-transferase
MRSSDEKTLLERTANLSKAFAKAEAAILNGPYFKGEQLSNVDIAWLPLLHRAHIIKQHTGFDFLEKFPKVQGLQEAIMASGLAERSVVGDFEKTFTDFYLSEQTYLGGSKLECATEGSCATDDACASSTCC